MKKVVVLSMLKVWSMDSKKGAPSFYRTLKGYIDNGWKVILITPHAMQGLEDELINIEIIKFRTIFDLFIRIPKIGHFFRLLNIKYAELIFYIKGCKYLKLNREKAVVYAYEVHGVRPGKKLSQKYKVPFITRFQGTVLEPVKDNIKNRIIYYPHFQALATISDLVIMTNDGTLGDKVLKKLGNTTNDIRFWRNGVDINMESKQLNDREIISFKRMYGIDKEDKILLTVSRLVHWKRVDRSIKALSSLSNEYKNVKLIIVGDGDERVNLENLAENLGVRSRVIFTGAVSHEEVEKFMRAADIFLSLYDLSNVGNPLLESMVLGKPIITLDVGDTSSIIKNNINGILLNISELELLPDKIKDLFNDNKYASKLGNEAKKYAKDNFWTWEKRIYTEVKAVQELLVSSKT